MALIAAAAFVAAGTAASPALAAPAPHSVAKSVAKPGNCIPVAETGACVSLDSIGENFELYIGTERDGSVQGFNSFSGFKSWAKTIYGISFSNSGGSLAVASTGGDGTDACEDDDDCGTNRPGRPTDCDDGDEDCDDNRPVRHTDCDDDEDCGSARPGDTDCDDEEDDCDDGGGGGQRRMAEAASLMASTANFYDKSSLTGVSFIVGKNDVKGNLATLSKPGGGSWNNRISSVRVHGSPAGNPGVQLCAKANCPTGPGSGWKIMLNNGDETTLTGVLNNNASFVGVF